MRRTAMIVSPSCLAELARSTGDELTAAQEFDLAYRQFTAIGAEGWLKNMTAAR